MSADLRERVERIKWFHRIDLGNGVVTCGEDPSPAKLERLKLPGDLTGKSVLDIGAFDGFFCFEAERRGASRVLATDWDAWAVPGGKDGFALAREVLGSKVEDEQIDLFELSPQRVGVFDVTLFLGVLYHMRHPLLALERIAAVTRELLVVETAVDMLFVRRPCMAFYPGAELKADHTNWVGPNAPAVTAMLHTVGFSDVKIVHRDTVARRVGRAIKWKVRDRGYRVLAGVQQGRMVFHARR